MNTLEAINPEPSQVALKTPSLKVNFIWTFAGTIIYSASNWGLMAILAKLGNPSMLGRYALGVAVVTPIFMLTNMNLRAVLATNAGKPVFRQYINLRLATTSIALCLSMFVALFQNLTVQLYVILLVGLIQGVEAISDIYYGVMQQSELMRPISISMICRGLLSVVTLAAVIRTTNNLVFGLVAVMLVRLSVLAAFDQRYSKGLVSSRSEHVVFAKRVQNVTHLLVLAFPLGVVLMLSSLTSAIPTYFIRYHLGIAKVGIYAAIISLLSVGSAVINALGQSAMPRLAKLYSNGQLEQFLRTAVKVLAVGAVVGLSGLLAARFAGGLALRLMYGSEYAADADVLVAAMLAGIGIYMGMLLGYINTAARAFRPQVPLFLVAVTTSVLACLALVRPYALVGAASAMGVAALVNIFGQILVLRRSLTARMKTLSVC